MSAEKPRPRWLVVALAGAGALAIVLAGVTFAQATSLRSSPGEVVNLGPIVGEQSPATTISVTPSPASSSGPTPTGSPTPSPSSGPLQPSLPTGGIQAPVPVEPVAPSQVDDDDDDDDDDDGED
ncbi:MULTISPECIES: hypothetical protein [unclassified Pseudoclavibacter]|uniref:hypothetical protein n=1 Tax=unclassified Pseudoclavibacter TaxID=2615177 RepID=UPI000CE9330A|nr:MULTISPECIES: hypothetical protein [unclassified Pseudoclavibacter]PPF74649.1 hypothetical protein C5B99_14705 [Pseudoclavibacter sp. Z016]PPG00694.1 hypothetical protein C5E06_18560 [Pseudoclavibacter sp. RFBI5]